MKSSKSPVPAPPYLGHVKNGVVVLDAGMSLPDGQAVRVEPLGEVTERSVDADREQRVRRMRELFGQWTNEDAKLSDAEAGLVRAALAEHRGLEFRSPPPD